MTLMTNDLNDHFFWRKGEGKKRNPVGGKGNP